MKPRSTDTSDEEHLKVQGSGTGVEDYEEDDRGTKDGRKHAYGDGEVCDLEGKMLQEGLSVCDESEPPYVYSFAFLLPSAAANCTS